MKRKSIFSLVLLSICLVAFGGTFLRTSIIDPTGTYKTQFKDSNGELPQGIIKVNAISRRRIVVNLHMQNGGPTFRSGSMVDTLVYINNKATFKGSEIDSTCRITFLFTEDGVSVKQKSTFDNYACDFANGVNANGYYKKVTSIAPKN